MTTNHNASDELLLAYAAGQLSPAPSLVVASHLAMSEASAERLAAFEQLGGALLDEQPMGDVAPDLFERMMARLDMPAQEDQIRIPRDHSSLDIGVELPAPLAERRIGKWRTVAPGIRFATVDVAEDPKYKVLLLRVGPGRALPQHGHTGSELTLILKGCFSDQGGRYCPGDIDEEDSESNHQPKVDADHECICLTVIEGSLRPNNWIARLVMPLFGF
ncbi:MAG: transcriptional regulator [Rhizobium sp.]|nr:transcriptional regulator [Rhizobium sp.]